jgi:hypothetical protein
VLVFGSYARGAPEPRDIDVAVDIDRLDARWRAHLTYSLSYGRDPYSLLRQALVGRARGISFLFERGHGHDDIPMTDIWRRGETVDVAVRRLHKIPLDPAAGRAPRGAMLPVFEGLEEWLPRYLRQEMIGLIDAKVLIVDQLMLMDAFVDDPWLKDQLDRRWASQSPLRRAADAALTELQSRGIDPRAVHLHGRDISAPLTPYFVGFQLRYTQSALRCFADHAGVEWVEVAHPTRHSPLLALRLRPGESFELYKKGNQGTDFFS